MQANVKKAKRMEAIEKVSAPVVHIFTETRAPKNVLVEKYHHSKETPQFNKERIFRCRKYDFL